MTLDLVACLPFAALSALMAVDELHFHRRRGLGRFEALGHPVDTATVALALAVPAFVPLTPWTAAALAVLALVSCLCVTKDEAVHLAECGAAEQRLHALLFMLHPLVFLAAAWLWYRADVSTLARPVPLTLLRAQLAAVLCVGAYQLFAWRKAWLPQRA